LGGWYLIIFHHSQNYGIAKRDISDAFEVTDLSELIKIVGIEITWDCKNKKITITQTSYIEAILIKYGLQDASPVCTPLDPNIKLKPGETEPGNRSNNYVSFIGSLMYAAVATRPDIAFDVIRLASFTDNPTICHWTASKHVLRYLKGANILELHIPNLNLRIQKAKIILLILLDIISF
jgi:hypothetical protein